MYMYRYAIHLITGCGVSVCIQVCTTNREGGGWGGGKLPAGGGRDPV